MKKISIITIVSGIILTIILVLGSSYALFYSESKFNNKETYTTGILDIELVNEEGYNTSLTLSNSLPLTDEKGKQTTPFKLKLKNNGNLSYTFDLKLINNTKENNLDTNYLKIMIDNDNPVKYNTLNDGIIKSNITLNPNKEIVIEVRLWLDENTPNNQIGKTFNGKIVVEGEGKEYIDLSRTSSEMLAYLGLTSNGVKNYPISETTTSEENGIWETEDDYGTSYYFRGDVDNNNIVFAGFNWKIIRINGNGSLRLLLNYTCPYYDDEGYCGSYDLDYAYDYEDKSFQYVGYMHGINDLDNIESVDENIYDSTIKIALDNWYEENIVNYGFSSKVENDVVYCNDRSIFNILNNALPTPDDEPITNKLIKITYNYYDRISKQSPTLICSQIEKDGFSVNVASKGNKKLKYPIATMLRIPQIKKKKKLLVS